MITKDRIAGVILAGGKASRMDFRDKPLMLLQDKPIIEHVIALAAPQVAELVISVNRNPSQYDYLGKSLIGDVNNPFAGPLLGIYSAMQWIRQQPHQRSFDYLACFAGDVPCFPDTLVQTLADNMQQAQCPLAISQVGAQIEPLFSLWSLSTAPVLAAAISDGLYGPKLVMSRITHTVVTISKENPADFFNINTPDDFTRITSMYT